MNASNTLIHQNRIHTIKSNTIQLAEVLFLRPILSERLQTKFHERRPNLNTHTNTNLHPVRDRQQFEKVAAFDVDFARLHEVDRGQHGVHIGGARDSHRNRANEDGIVHGLMLMLLIMGMQRGRGVRSNG